MTHKRANGRPTPQVRTREALPSMRQTKEGTQILCPFCSPTHPIVPGQQTVCGTVLELKAIQTVVPARVARNNKIVCMKCHLEGSGEMVQYGSGYIHLVDCMPGTNFLRVEPEYDWFAGFVYRLPKPIRQQVVKLTGYPQQVRDIGPDGLETGKIAGYFFLKGNANGNAGQTTEPSA